MLMFLDDFQCTCHTNCTSSYKVHTVQRFTVHFGLQKSIATLFLKIQSVDV